MFTTTTTIEMKIRPCLEIDYSTAFDEIEDYEDYEDRDCHGRLKPKDMQIYPESKYPRMVLVTPSSESSAVWDSAPYIEFSREEGYVSKTRRAELAQESLQVEPSSSLRKEPQLSEVDDDYSDAEEEVEGPGPSGNRKMRRKPLQKMPKKHNNRKVISPVKTTISRVIGVPDVAITRLQYNDVITLTGTTAQYTFRANSMFDPDFTGTGHQPSYFDQYIASYERYRVVACTITVSVINRSFTDPAMVAIFPVTDVPTITSISQAAEIPRRKITGILPSYQTLPIKRTIKMSTAEQIGLFSPSTVYTDDYAALFNANPVVLWYYGIYGWCPTSGGLDVILDVQLSFDCQFFDRAPSTLSLEQQLARQTKICGDINLAWKKRCLDKKSL